MYIKWEKVGNKKSWIFMLIGEYIHTIDDKNRVSLPAKFRKEMGKKVIVTPGLDQCLFIFTMGEWEKVTKKLSSGESDLSFLSQDQRTFNRNMFGQATDVEVDSIGRVLIPDYLKEKIKAKGKVAMVGVQDRVEVWNDATWAEFKKEAEKQAEPLAEKLSKGS
jgi:MraZ protein